jgi:hypothetical protein
MSRSAFDAEWDDWLAARPAPCTWPPAAVPPLALKGRTVVLDAPLKVNAARPLHATGPGAFVGSGHSVFQVGGKDLTLENVAVRHVVAADRADRKAAGAAIFVQGAGRVALESCVLDSQGGFALWLKQRATGTLTNCALSAGRTAVAVFNEASLTLDRCAVRDGDPHGVCARGFAVVSLTDCSIENTAIRAVYGYMSASITLRNVRVSGTRDATQAAVQVEALRPGDAASLDLGDSTTFLDNAGLDVACAGSVTLRGAGSVDVGSSPASGPNAFGVGRPKNPLQ